MNSGIASLHKVLKDETRSKIILLLQERGSLSYVDLMKALGITNTGKINYHLKVLGDLLSKKENGEYTLSEKGTLASRLLLEFPEGPASRLRLSPQEPQVLWWGIIICIFTIIGLYGLYRLFFDTIASGYLDAVGVVENSVPYIFLCASFLFIGSYMIVSGLKKKSNKNRKLSNFTRIALVVCTLFIIVLGVALLGVANTLPTTVEHLDKIGYKENPGANYTIFLDRGVYRYDIVVDNATKLDQSLNMTITYLEGNETHTLVGGTINGQTIEEEIFLDGGHYNIDLQGLNVTKITVFLYIGEIPSMLRLTWLATGVFTLIAGILSFLVSVLLEFPQGLKTGVFWWGLIIFGLALSWLSADLWIELVLVSGPHPNVYSYPISLALLLIGFLMIKRGARKENQPYGLRTSKLEFYLSQRNYRALVYLLASMIISLTPPDFYGHFNFIGFLLLFMFYGRPSMWGGWYDPADALPNLLSVFGLFVEIFIVCEFIISLKKLVHRTSESKPSNSAV